MSHIASKKQEKLFKKAVDALKKCQKAGLVILAKSWDLTAYTKDAEMYIRENRLLSERRTKGGTIPHLIGHACISDSGGDDYPNYLTEADEREFNPETFSDNGND